MLALIPLQRVPRLDQILENICEELQLTETQYQAAEQRYHAVGDWLVAENSPIRSSFPWIFPQGSLLLRTTVKPLRQLEYDLDLVCLMRQGGSLTPGQAYRLIWDRLKASGIYRPLIEPLARCIRLNYAESSQFHLDVVPAIPDPYSRDGRLLIPERGPHLISEEGVWRTTNPLKYAHWVESRTVPVTKFSADRHIEPLPSAENTKDKPALKRVVQLLKRWRDIVFFTRQGHAPSSIILTTLAAASYHGQQNCSVALGSVLGQIAERVRYGKFVLYNPVNPEECISERWEKQPETFDSFAAAITEFNQAWIKISGTQGIGEISDGLAMLFGDRVGSAVKKAYDSVSTFREQRQLSVTRDTRSLVYASPRAISVPRNTFHGN